MPINLNSLLTESINPASRQIDCLSTIEILQIINQEDKKVALAVEKELANIGQAVDIIYDAFTRDGRLIYIGAGTSGRLGILDASECPPTYGVEQGLVVGVIAGGQKAIFQAVENAEDNPQLAVEDLTQLNLRQNDVVVGIAASGRTPYVIGGMKYAKSVGCSVVSLSCNPDSEMVKLADIAITPVVGPEVITGSSRMKAGTAQKMVLNMLTTTVMIKSGKVFGNLMVDVEATNAKLVQRQINIVMQATDCTEKQAKDALSACKSHCKTAIVMLLAGGDASQAQQLLAKNNGFIRQALADKGQGNGQG